MNKTDQMQAWSTTFGQEYTQRNLRTPYEMDTLFRENLGISRIDLNREFLCSLDRSIRILEVGANVGTQLMILQNMGFEDLTGIELQHHALELAKKRTKSVRLFQATAFDLPFEDRCFDLVFTSGVLIHIHPHDIGKALDEIHRCTRRYIWGYEYYNRDYENIIYRGKKDLLWKADFARIYRERFPDLEIVNEKHYKYLKSEAVDSMFLLRKAV